MGSGMSRVLPPLTTTPRSPQPGGEISDAESRDRFAAHAGVAEDEKIATSRARRRSRAARKPLPRFRGCLCLPFGPSLLKRSALSRREALPTSRLYRR